MSAAGGGRRIIVLGGNSEIALAIVRELAPRQVALVGRDPRRLDDAAASLHGKVETVVLGEDADAAVGSAFERLGGADLVVVAVGRLGERGGIPDELGDAVEVLRVNVVVAGALLLAAARRLRDQGHGTLIVLSSVAGERVRPAESRLWRGESRPGRARPGPCRRPPRRRRERARRAPGVRPHADDERPAPAAARNRRRRRGARGAPRARAGNDIVWTPAVLRPIMMAMRLLQRAILRRLPI